MNWDRILARTHAPDKTGNHGTAVIDPHATPPQRSLGDRMTSAVKRASDRFRSEGEAASDHLTPARRKEIAEEYRETADRLERGA